MVNIVQQLARARDRSGRTAADVGAATGLTTSNIYALERGTREPRSSTLERTASGLGLRVVAVDLGRTPLVADVSEAMKTALDQGDDKTAYRLFVGLSLALEAAPPSTRVLSACVAPVPVSAEWDAALAGLVHWRLSEHELDAPSWVTAAPLNPLNAWAPPTSTSVTDVELREVPEQLAIRGVWIREDDLNS